MGQVCITEMSLIHQEWNPDERNNDWSLDEWNDEWSCVGWHEGWERLCNTSVDTFASSFSLERSERVNVNLDTVDTFLVKFDREGVGDGSFYGCITGVDAWRFQGTDAHRVLSSNASAYAPVPASKAVEIASKEQ